MTGVLTGQSVLLTLLHLTVEGGLERERINEIEFGC